MKRNYITIYCNKNAHFYDLLQCVLTRNNSDENKSVLMTSTLGMKTGESTVFRVGTKYDSISKQSLAVNVRKSSINIIVIGIIFGKD